MASQRRASAPKQLIAVVDDDPAVRNSLRFSLEVEGYRVRAYASADELLREPELARVGCVIADQNMPGMNGLDLIERLRAGRYGVPAILITTHPALAVTRRAADFGVPIVEKPLLGNALLDEVRQMIGR
jgi:FixJ family two-component response regulator